LDKKKKRLLIASIDAAAKVELDGDDVVLEFYPDAKHSRDTLAKADNAKIIREACAEICGRDVGIRFSVCNGEGDEVPASVEEEQRRSKQRAGQAAAQTPTVQKVLRAFGGEIVDVKMQ